MMVFPSSHLFDSQISSFSKHFSVLQSPVCFLPSISHCVNTVCLPACYMSSLHYTFSIDQESVFLAIAYLASSTVLLQKRSSVNSIG